MDPLRKKIVDYAFFSRFFIIALSVTSNALIPDHIAQDVFHWVKVPLDKNDATPKPLDGIISFMFEGLTRWDGQYFLHIANNGYTYENSVAFFPFFPQAVSILAYFVHWCQVDYDLVSFYSCLMLSSTIINLLGFVLASLTLFELSRKVLKDEYLSYKATLYFCINPASIFFSAAYSETLFCLFSFYAMLKIEKAFKLQMSLLLCLPSATRANGVINIGFALFKSCKIIAKEIFTHKRLGRYAEMSTTIANIIGDALVPAFFSFFLGLFPFLFTQWYAFMHFCRLTKPDRNISQAILDYAHLNPQYKLPSEEPSPWCRDSVPIPYSYVQNHYWKVGFFGYYQLKQIPNFLLAVPIFVLVFWRGYEFLKVHRSFCKRLGLIPFYEPNDYNKLFKIRSLPKECFVYVVHSMCLAAFCLLFINVQVTTRMLCSSCPVIYWYAALLTTPPHQKHMPLIDSSKITEYSLKIERKSNLESMHKSIVTDEVIKDSVGKWLRIYFVSYAIIGTIMFSNFLPWT